MSQQSGTGSAQFVPPIPETGSLRNLRAHACMYVSYGIYANFFKRFAGSRLTSLNTKTRELGERVVVVVVGVVVLMVVVVVVVVSGDATTAPNNSFNCCRS